MSPLHTLREILSMRGDNPLFVFTSIELVRPGFGFSEPSARPGEELVFRLTHEGAAAERINGHLFDEDTGHLIERVASLLIQNQLKSILCKFKVPNKLTAKRVCLIIEGQRASSDPGGCEMSFSIVG